MITNKVVCFKKKQVISIPVLIRMNKLDLEEKKRKFDDGSYQQSLFSCHSTQINQDDFDFDVDWIPEIEMMKTIVTPNDAVILCPNSFANWKILVDQNKLNLINEKMSGTLGVTKWNRRYSTYVRGTGNYTWLHSIIMGGSVGGQIDHHINGISNDNRIRNLQRLNKKLHDSINHADLEERKKMFCDFDEFYQEEFADNLLKTADYYKNYLLFSDERTRKEVVCQMYKTFNPRLLKEIFEIISLSITNLDLESTAKYTPHRSIVDNQHLSNEYLDCFEMSVLVRRKNFVEQTTLF